MESAPATEPAAPPCPPPSSPRHPGPLGLQDTPSPWKTQPGTTLGSEIRSLSAGLRGAASAHLHGKSVLPSWPQSSVAALPEEVRTASSVLLQMGTRARKPGVGPREGTSRCPAASACPPEPREPWRARATRSPQPSRPEGLGSCLLLLAALPSPRPPLCPSLSATPRACRPCG